MRCFQLTVETENLAVADDQRKRNFPDEKKILMSLLSVFCSHGGWRGGGLSGEDGGSDSSPFLSSSSEPLVDQRCLSEDKNTSSHPHHKGCELSLLNQLIRKTGNQSTVTSVMNERSLLYKSDVF